MRGGAEGRRVLCCEGLGVGDPHDEEGLGACVGAGRGLEGQHGRELTRGEREEDAQAFNAFSYSRSYWS